MRKKAQTDRTDRLARQTDGKVDRPVEGGGADRPTDRQTLCFLKLFPI